jgi:predicted small lipoprotein YifL
MTLAPHACGFPQIGGFFAVAGSVHAMLTALPRPLRAPCVLALVAALAGCGKSASLQAPTGGPAAKIAPVAAQGTVSVSTRNTTRLGGADAATDAAAVARAVYPGFTTTTRPQSVVLVDERDWAGALAASALAGAPLATPLLYGADGSLPAVSAQTLQSMHPSGAAALGGAQVIRIGNTAATPRGYVARSLPGGEAAPQAAAVARLLISADGGVAPHQAIVLVVGTPRALQMPAAGLAAESGAPILFVTAKRVPRATAAVLTSMHRPAIYVIGSSSADMHALRRLRRFGAVTTITASSGEEGNAVANSLALARFTDGTFGWGVKEPGHGLVFADAARPLDGPAAAILSATGDYGPPLLLEAADEVPAAVAKYLGDIQPAYTPSVPPVRGVYNHAWLIGDERAISAVVQAEIDSALEIVPHTESAAEAPAE